MVYVLNMACPNVAFVFLFFRIIIFIFKDGISPNASFSVFNIFKDSVSEYSLLCFLLFLFLTMV